jgi:bifunctional non-homologous end joining protein LigD
MARVPRKCCGGRDEREALRPVVSVARHDLYVAAHDIERHAIAIPLDLIKPSIAGRHLIHEPRKAWLNPPWHRALNVDSAIIDGEVVMLDDMGRSHFFDLHATASGKYAPDAICYVFDLLWLNGEDLRDRPLSDRRLELEGLGLGESGIYFSEEFEGDGEAFYREACRADLEGIVAKRRDSKYRSGRSDEWRKIKCVKSAEFVVIGYLPSKVPGAIASLLVAEKDGKTLRYAGAVGTGYSHVVAVALKQGLDAIRATEPAIGGLRIKGAVWTRPQLLAQVDFRGWTTGHELRHASFKGLSEKQ